MWVTGLPAPLRESVTCPRGDIFSMTKLKLPRWLGQKGGKRFFIISRQNSRKAAVSAEPSTPAIKKLPKEYPFFFADAATKKAKNIFITKAKTTSGISASYAALIMKTPPGVLYWRYYCYGGIEKIDNFVLTYNLLYNIFPLAKTGNSLFNGIIKIIIYSD